MFSGQATALVVHGHIVGIVWRCHVFRGGKCVGNGVVDVVEAYAVGKKSGYGDLVGRIDCTCHSTAAFHGGVGKSEAGEALYVRSFESECGDVGER